MGDSTAKSQRTRHKRLGDWPDYIDPRGSNPGGKCWCECGGDAPISTQSIIREGLVIGQPRKYIIGHHMRRYTEGYEVTDTGYDTPCWLWTGCVAQVDYGVMSHERYAHVVFYEEAKGAVPEGMHVHHHCEQKRCVNPDHLEALTQLAHRRFHMKISMEMREEIRRASGSTRQIALRFGVSKSHVALIRRPDSPYS